MNLAWNSWSEFFAMGGYGLFVWGSFAVTGVVMLGETWAVRARHKALLRGEADMTLEGSRDET
jgi:heme exporter protein D